MQVKDSSEGLYFDQSYWPQFLKSPGRTQLPTYDRHPTHQADCWAKPAGCTMPGSIEPEMPAVLINI